MKGWPDKSKNKRTCGTQDPACCVIRRQPSKYGHNLPVSKFLLYLYFMKWLGDNSCPYGRCRLLPHAGTDHTNNNSISGHAHNNLLVRERKISWACPMNWVITRSVCVVPACWRLTPINCAGTNILYGPKHCLFVSFEFKLGPYKYVCLRTIWR